MNSRSGDLEPTTYKSYVSRLNAVLLPAFGDIPAININHHRVDQLVNKRTETVKRNTVSHDIKVLKAILNWAVDRQYLTHNPIARYKRPKDDTAIITPPTDIEARAILAETEPPASIRGGGGLSVARGHLPQASRADARATGRDASHRSLPDRGAGRASRRVW